MKTILVILAAVLFTGCASQTSFHKMSDAGVTRVVQGTVLKASVQKTVSRKELTVQDTATTAVAANNVGNSTVQGGLLLLGLLDHMTTPTRWTWHLIINDRISGGEQEFEADGMTNRHIPEVGEEVRIICKERCQVFNLTKAPQLASLTK